MDPLYGFVLGHGAQTRLMASLNGVPLYRAELEPDGCTRSGVANHLLSPGENSFELVVDTLEPWGGVLFSLARDHNHAAPAFALRLPDLSRPDGPSIQSLPYVHHARFELTEITARPAFFAAPPADFGPDGTPELREAVQRFHGAILRGDVDAMVEEARLKIAEHRRIYPNEDELSEASSRAELAAFFASPAKVRPIAWDNVVFRRCSGGRVAFVTRRDGRPLIEAVNARGHTMRRDLWLTTYEGRWSVFL
ncbi:MAG: hypothetical protein L6Q76_11080 [Polyangiaceae bacterium]|nr:hypothetical protein [Polyangiaceae bacterium]